MKKYQKTHELIVFMAIFYLISPSAVHAYLDPGTGSYVIQVVIGIFVGIAFVFKNFWRNILAFAKGTFGKKEVLEDAGNETETPAE